MVKKCIICNRIIKNKKKQKGGNKSLRNEMKKRYEDLQERLQLAVRSYVSGTPNHILNEGFDPYIEKHCNEYYEKCKHVKELDRAISLTKPLSDMFILYRGIRLTESEQRHFEETGILNNKAFTSASFSKDWATFSNDTCCLMEIIVMSDPKLKYVYVGSSEIEQEIIFQRKTHFQLLEVDTTKYNKVYKVLIKPGLITEKPIINHKKNKIKIEELLITFSKNILDDIDDGLIDIDDEIIEDEIIDDFFNTYKHYKSLDSISLRSSMKGIINTLTAN